MEKKILTYGFQVYFIQNITTRLQILVFHRKEQKKIFDPKPQKFPKNIANLNCFLK